MMAWAQLCYLRASGRPCRPNSRSWKSPLRRRVYPRDFKARLNEGLRQRSGAAANIHYASDGYRRTAEPSHNVGRRTTCKSSVGSGLNICKILLVECTHE